MVKKMKDKNAPKKPKTSFLLFGEDKRSQDPALKAMKINEQAAIIAKQWKEISPEEKEKYVQKAEELKKDYTVRKAEYEKTDDYKNFLEASKASKSKKEGITKKAKKTGKAKEEGYDAFVNEMKDASNDENDLELAGKSFKERCAVKWSRLSAEEKKNYAQEEAEESD
ncbi:hypothetical protein ENBRE01_1041 [Enteropsectra breve]|nr:hypothetical protein ENBRE01_1041 [Enteropsectra breve]